MNKFEYIVEEYPYGLGTAERLEFEEKINALGKNGWELISANTPPFKNERSNSLQIICIFKKLLEYG